jgi:hypothetical protein
LLFLRCSSNPEFTNFISSILRAFLDEKQWILFAKNLISSILKYRKSEIYRYYKLQTKIEIHDSGQLVCGKEPENAYKYMSNTNSIQIIIIQRYDDHIDHRRRGARGGPRGGGVVHPYLLGAAR